MKKIITIQADDIIYNKLADEARSKMLSLSALIRLIILKYYEQKND